MIRRHLFTFVSAVSLSLWVATVVLWVRSYYFLDGIPILQWHSIGVESLVGSGAVHWTADNASSEGGLSPPAMHVSIKDKSYLEDGFHMEAAKWHVAGFGYLSVDLQLAGGRVIKSRGLTVPYWLPFGCAAMMPAIWLIARLRNRSRPVAGRCSRCGYNLTANTSGVCPECGTAIQEHRKSVA